ncbi:MAG TPA: GNAT family N-acetyltransferase [Clostridia bacterium]|nr:GNAT family N-acetyltransferase [Clostridia bacterium]
MFFKELETKRLLIKNIACEDREFILAQFSNDEVNRYLFDAEPLVDLKGADEIIAFYTRPEPRCQHRWILVRKEDGAKIGTCGFHCWDMNHGTCDMGYDLSPAFWNMGYMGEAAQGIIRFARENMRVERIDAHISANNRNSAKLAEKLGFVDSGRQYSLAFRGGEYPHRVYSLYLTREA